MARAISRHQFSVADFFLGRLPLILFDLMILYHINYMEDFL